MSEMIDTLIGPLALQDLDVRDVLEEMPQGNKSVTRRYYLNGELVRQDIEIHISSECMAAMGLTERT